MEAFTAGVAARCVKNTASYAISKRGGIKAKSPAGKPRRGFSIKFPAATYSPTPLPVQYHRPREA